jgi:hypothetical protein
VKRHAALVEAQKNPLAYGRPISREDLADREDEKRALVTDDAGAPRLRQARGVRNKHQHACFRLHALTKAFFTAAPFLR